ncbi:MAG: hypothetical protein L6461_10890 [Anaerolineae bacterium]|nr:hypothetical protein [Anaerolineae bacterium]
MWEDEIVEETRRIRKEYAAQFKDLAALCRDLQEKEAKSGRKVVSFPPRKPVVVQVRQRTESAIADEKGKYKTTK